MTNKKDFNKLKKILSETHPFMGGPLKITNLDSRIEILKLGGILLEPKKKDCLIYIKYFPEEDRYGFSVYEEEK
ncbi:MAG: hypothetical protein WC812_02640 [Candidatus Pacearchaeota archaeon]|jgi:hypothetical protein